MLDMLGNPSRTELMMRSALDSGVHSALSSAKLEGASERDIQDLVQLAASNALIQYAAMIQMEINRINLDERRRHDERWMRHAEPAALAQEGLK